MPADGGTRPATPLRRRIRPAPGTGAAESVLASVVDAAADAVIITDVDGLITHWNPAAERLSGWPATAMIGTSARALIEREHRIEVARLVRDVAAGHPVRIPHMEITLGRGVTVPVDISISPVTDADGDIHSIVVIVRDISEHYAAAADLRAANAVLERQTSELVAANERLATFATRLSHDLRQPLTALGGFLNLLLEHKPHLLDEQAET